MLERDGIIYSVPGRGAFLSDDHGGIIRQNAVKEFRSAVERARTSGLTEKDMTDIIHKMGEEK